MVLSAPERRRLQKACDRLGDGPDYRCNNYIWNLMLSALDFQLDAEKVVNQAIDNFDAKYGYSRVHNLKRLVAKYPNTNRGNVKLANDLWGYNLWTRAEFLRKIIQFFDREGVTGQKSLVQWLDTVEFEKDVKGKIKSDHHSIGPVLFEWLRLRSGFKTIKADTHILNFVENAVGRRVLPPDALEALLGIAKKARRKPYRLDSAIWHFQRDRA